MTRGSSVASRPPAAADGGARRPGALPRLLWGCVALVVLVSAAVATGLRWSPAPDGLPDAGALVVDGLPLLRLATLLAGGVTLGFALSGLALDPAAKAGRPSPGGRRDLRTAATAAGLLALSSGLLSLLTLADVLGLPLGQALDPAIVLTYLWDVETARAQVITAVLAVGAAIGLPLARTLGTAAAWTFVAVIAVGLPSLTGHSAGLGNHSLALVSGFLHSITATMWAGGAVAVATHAVRGSAGIRERARRFGVVAVIAVAALAVTGVGSAVTRLDSVSQLVTTPYGRILLAKSAALAGALALAAVVRWARTGVPRRVLLAELVALGTALGLAVVLARSPFPRVGVELPTQGEELIGYPYPPAPSLGRVALGWHPDWVWLSAAVLAIGAYLAGWMVLRRRGDAWPIGRMLSWVTGWLIVVWATCAGVAWYAPVSFALHMVSHMALSMLAPVFLVLGGPVTLALRVVPTASGGDRGPREWITWALHAPLTRFLTHPGYVLTVYTVGLYGIYYTGLYAWLMSTHLGHFGMQVHFLAAGYLFYWVVIGVDAGPRPLPHSARLILLMASLVIHSFFAVPMMMTESPMVAEWYAVVRPPWLVDPVADTNLAGGIAWGFGEIPTLLVAIALGFQWARSDEREARRLDRRAELDGDAELTAYNARLARLNERSSGGGDAPGGDSPS